MKRLKRDKRQWAYFWLETVCPANCFVRNGSRRNGMNDTKLRRRTITTFATMTRRRRRRRSWRRRPLQRPRTTRFPLFSFCVQARILQPFIARAFRNFPIRIKRRGEDSIDSLKFLTSTTEAQPRGFVWSQDAMILHGTVNFTYRLAFLSTRI